MDDGGHRPFSRLRRAIERISQNAGAGVEEAGARRPDLAARLIHHAGLQDDLGSDSGNFGDTRQPGASRRRIHHTTLLD
jgi:hypothetical protein